VGHFSDALVWFVGVAGAILGGVIIVLTVRKWSRRDVRTETFTIQGLRELRARGQISEQEFAAMRAALLSGLKTPDRAAPAKVVPPPHPAADE
jgi:hypothetical protein